MNRRQVLVLLSWLSFVEATAHAEMPQSIPDCKSTPACFSIYMQARQQSAQGNLSEALRLYKAAYEVRADPGIFFSIARVLHKQGQLPNAADYYRRFIDSPLDQPEQKRTAQKYLSQISTEPLYKKWWFWALVAGGTAAVAVGVGLGVGLTQQPSNPQIPAGAMVIPIVF